MKKQLLFLIITIFLVSCQKDNVINQPLDSEKEEISSTFLRSGDDDEDDDDDDDEDEENQCCSFSYGSWDSCKMGMQVRSWRGSSTNCIPPLDSIQRECVSANISYLYYNPLYSSVRVVSNFNGSLHIYNSNNQITSILSYSAGGVWVNVSFLPIDIYTVTTYGRTIRFTKQ